MPKKKNNTVTDQAVKGKKAVRQVEPLTPEDVIRSRITREQSLSALRSFVIKLVAFCLIIAGCFTFLFGVTPMSGESMYPRLRDGDLLFFYRIPDEYYIGDIVTFTDGKGRHVGRVIAKGGDEVDMTDEGELLINGNVQSEEIFYPTLKSEADISFPYTVEDGSVFLLSDMRTAGFDSRRYGGVSEKELDGKIITVLRRRGL